MIQISKITLLAILIWGCGIFPKSSKNYAKTDDPLFVVTSMGCLGGCPINSLWIDKKGNAEYISHYNAERVGLYRKTLSIQQIKFIEDLMRTEMREEKKIVEKMKGNEEVQPRTIYWYDDTIQKILKSKKGFDIFRTISNEIGIDSLDTWKYINGMGKTTLNIKKWNEDSSYLNIAYSSFGNILNITQYDKKGRQLSQKFKHILSAYNVYNLFETIDGYIKERPQKIVQIKRLYEITGELEVNPTQIANKNNKASEIKYKIDYNTSVKSIVKVNKEIDILIASLLKK